MSAYLQHRTISSAVRSLKTNLNLSLAFVTIFVCLSFFSNVMNVVMVTSMRGCVAIIITLANFSKVQNVFLIYWENSLEKLFAFIPIIMFKKNTSI
jgi:hypothetical protein